MTYSYRVERFLTGFCFLSSYVVKAVVYEIGILTEVGENDTSFESQERVDLTFYDTHSNKSHIDLGNIPLPIQPATDNEVAQAEPED